MTFYSTSITPTTEQLLETMNPQQRQAVTHEGSPLLVVAGAGSGKTTVLTGRIAYLLTYHQIPAEHILAITFTNKAAQQMRDRIGELVGSSSHSMWIATFHSTCLRILRAHASTIGLSSHFSIYDADDTRRVLHSILEENDYDTNQYSARRMAWEISCLKNDLITPEQAYDALGHDSEELNRVISEIYQHYQQRLRVANAVDFDDLIVETVHLFESYPHIGEHYHRRFRHILVDEYQDTNHAQYVLIRHLVGMGDNSGGLEPAQLCVVGDSDQSIYAFRGATVRNIDDFDHDYPQATVVLLEQNYRSTQNILSAANALIAHNNTRREKRLWTDSGQGEPIIGYVGENEHDEARFVAEEIDQLVSSGQAHYGQIAILYRTNNTSRALEDLLMRTGIPYRVIGGTRFYERSEIRDLIAYLRLVLNPDDTASLQRILNTPRRGIGRQTEAHLQLRAATGQISLMQALREGAAGTLGGLSTRSRNAVEKFVDFYDEVARQATECDNLTDLIELILERSGYRSELMRSSDPHQGTRLDNLDEFVNMVHEFQRDYPLTDQDLVGDQPRAIALLAALLEHIALVADVDEIDEEDTNEEGVVTLMTLHTAKGLEFPIVFLTGWEDGLFPHMRSLTRSHDLDEERRLAYVGITRAQRLLYISRAKIRSSWGNPVVNPPSRFFQEIPESLICWRDNPQSHRDHIFTEFSHNFSANHRQSLPKKPVTKPLLTLVPGDRVNHDKYGLGKVEEVFGSGTTAMALIDFGSAGRIKLMHNHAPIMKL